MEVQTCRPGNVFNEFSEKTQTSTFARIWGKLLPIVTGDYPNPDVPLLVRYDETQTVQRRIY